MVKPLRVKTDKVEEIHGFPLIVIRLTPEGFLEGFAIAPPDGTRILYASDDDVKSLHTTLSLAGALIDSLLEGLPLTGRVEGEGEPS